MAIIQTVSGDSYLVDDEAMCIVGSVGWCTGSGRGYKYAMKTVKFGKTRRTIYLSRVIASAPKGTIVDHINGDTTDNRLINLRVCTRSQNGAHRVILPKNNKSGVLGVHWDRRTKRWSANLKVNQKTINIGQFDSLDEAKSARERAALERFGEYASPLK